MEDPAYQRVALTEIGGVRVSTVWLGLNHAFGPGPRLIFETMIFGGDYNNEQWRYSTEDDAMRGHEEVAAALREGRVPDTSVAWLSHDVSRASMSPGRVAVWNLPPP